MGEGWNCPGRLNCPREEIEFLVQSLVVFVVILASLYNLTQNPESNTPLWISLLSCSFGIFVPGPSVKRVLDTRKKKKEENELDVSE